MLEEVSRITVVHLNLVSFQLQTFPTAGILQKIVL